MATRKLFNNRNLLSTTVASLLGLTCGKALADTPPAPTMDWERCFGIARAGENDCSSLDGSHRCSGHSLVDNDPNEYVWVPAGTCSKIVNGSPAVVQRSRRVKQWCSSKIKKLTREKSE